ncbi:cardiolipin synthase [Pseudobacillus wudalianchiensis]|uniref:Cardiolipin synthase n=1 Tax=Pseudobacillus wudalianchiensis TaxID=1743143 RepID=A0A1B9AUJ4_9BACI|nr:cardiolipin synthase [Bacillus wudalianchiensis]OCA87358.1 cardiolipin synthase [Bacillus wudalianchiensis]
MKNTIKVVGFVLVVVVLYILWADHYMSGLLKYTSVALTLSVIVISFLIFFENRHPTQTVTWLVVLGAFPLLGFIFYLLFGRSYRKERMFKKKYILDKETYQKYNFTHTKEDLKQHFQKYGEHKIYALAERLGNMEISFHTETELLTNGAETFESILKELKKARHHIHLEYYIVRADDIGNEIKEVLIAKAREGVKVRFLYDAVGSWKLSKAYIQELREAGIEMVAFGPVKMPFLNSKFNFRNHRKIIVIDGKVGFVGGLNIGDEYLGKDPQFGFWRDTHLYVRGEAVRSLQLIFLQDWYYMTNDSFITPGYLTPEPEKKVRRTGGVQMIAGGPDNEWSVIKNVFFSMITSAQEFVWIASPYFIPDEDIFSALKIAALSGVDVRLLVPKRPDKRIVFHASRSYFPELLEAGARIFEYREGFMHSKFIIVDGEIASIGTSNMDMRSFHLNFEVNAFLYHTHSIESLVREYLNDLNASDEIDLEDFNGRHLGYRLIESTSRLLSPLL